MQTYSHVDCWVLAGHCLLLLALLLGSSVQLVSAAASPKLLDTPELRADGKAAAAFCSGPAIKQRSCGWADAAEQAATARGQVPVTGTVWWGPLPPLPANVTNQRISFKLAGKIVSLACRPGKVLVRTVFKPTKVSGRACVWMDTKVQLGTLASNASVVSRCRLALPPHKPGEEQAAAVRSKEVDCRPCPSCKDCPHQALGVWYSDTYTASYEGCRAVMSGTPYLAFIPAIVVNPGTEFELAKFEVQEVN